MSLVDLSGLGEAAEGLFSGPLIKLEPSPTYKVNKFPDDIADSPYFVVFRMVNKPVMKIIGRSAGGNLFGGGSPFARIASRIASRSIDNFSVPARGYALPMPSNLVTGYNAQYNDSPIGSLGAIGKRMGENFTGPDGGSYYKGITNAIKNANIGPQDLKVVQPIC